MPQTATYVYCLVERPRPPATTRLPRGLPGTLAPDLLQIDQHLWGVVTQAPLATYGADALEARLRDVNWVADLALAHESVVEHFAKTAGTTVVPMKLLTMFSSPARAVADLTARRREIAAVMKRLRGSQEWGVRVTRRPEAVSSGTKRTGGASGTAFLAAKKQARDAAREQTVKAAAVAETAFKTLTRLSRESRRREAPAEATTPPLVDAAFLVPLGRRATFRSTARRLGVACRKAGADLTLTGPWPAYNFVQGEQE